MRHAAACAVVGWLLTAADANAWQVNQGPAKAPKQDAFGDPLPQGTVARLGTVRFTEGEYIHALAFVPGSKHVAVMTYSSIHIRAVDTWKDVAWLHGPLCGTWGLAIAPDGKNLVAATSGGFYYCNLVDGKTRTSVRTVNEHPQCVAWSPDGKSVAVGGYNGILRVYVAGTGTVRKQFQGESGTIYAVAWSPDGTLLATATEQGSVVLWDAATGEVVWQLSKGKGKGTLFAVNFSADGSSVAVKIRQGGIKLWDVKTGKPLPAEDATPHQREHFPRQALSKDGKLLAVADDNRVRFFAMPGKKLVAPKEDHGVQAHALAFVPGKHQLVTEERGKIRVWDLDKLVPVLKVEGQFGYAWDNPSMVFSADGKSIVVVAWLHEACWIDAASGKISKDRISLVPGSGRYAIALAPGGQLAAASYGQSRVSLTMCDPLTGKQLNHWDGLGGANVLAFSPDGKILAEAHGTYDGPSQYITLRDTQTGKEIRRLKIDREQTKYFNFQCITWSPDAKLLVVGTANGVLFFFDAANGQLVKTLMGDFGTARGLAFSADGRWLASSSGSDTVLLWEFPAILKQ